jgi:hypothetical protein
MAKKQTTRDRKNKRARAHYRKNKKRILTEHSEWRAANPGYHRKYYGSNKELWRARRLRFHYGITLEEYASLLKAQGGRCAVCQTDRPSTRWQTIFCVDHDHESGDVRGLLCVACNLVLGHVRDDPNILRAMIAYLEQGES